MPRFSTVAEVRYHTYTSIQIRTDYSGAADMCGLGERNNGSVAHTMRSAKP